LVSASVLEKWNGLSDAQIAAQVMMGRTALFEMLMRRHNEHLYRTVRAIISDDDKAEELLQQVFANAYANLRQFDRTTPFAIWLTRIAVKTASPPLTRCSVRQATARPTVQRTARSSAGTK
jgi:RNA polymerase sigma-70 factor (ECF subfamily)